MVETAREKGQVTTLYGRIRPVPELKSSNFMQRNFGERIAMNSPIQGTAADIMKIAMIRVDKRLHEEGLKARIILQVHDELLVETPIEEQEQVNQLLREEMEAAAHLSVKLEVSVSDGNSWYETK
jgi:DNA polymerase-1